MRPLLRGLGAAGAAAVTLSLPAVPASAAELHNISYIARVDGLGRGISVTFKTDPVDRRTEQPRLGPGESWEVNLVMEDPAQAGMTVRVLPPYGVGLHCEVQVDDVVVDSQDLTVPPALGIFNGPVNDSVTCGHFNA
ncbi:hypothetical protein [Mycobacteroides salmoniphilum]|uniref:hypothetical protein n=1 Tax=Mycobacteroides salmoniphilum TaxID=404941 RepID=UPI00099482D3|nr:hypothetical protein [Mycobacteroides salmoniphilum]